MNPLIEYCEQNFAKEDELLQSDTYINENADIVSYSCMNECNFCSQNYFVFFEGERITGETTSILIENIRKAISSWKNEMD